MTFTRPSRSCGPIPNGTHEPISWFIAWVYLTAGPNFRPRFVLGSFVGIVFLFPRSVGRGGTLPTDRETSPRETYADLPNAFATASTLLPPAFLTAALS